MVDCWVEECGPQVLLIVFPFNPERESAPRRYTLAGLRADPMVLYLGVHVKSRASVLDPNPSQYTVALSKAHI